MKGRILAVDAFIERRFFILGLLILGGGLLAGQGLAVLRPLTPIFLALTMFTGALNCSLDDFRRVLYTPGTILLALGLMYIITPIITLGLTKLFFVGEPLLAAGQLFSSTLPVGITASVWTMLAGGNLPLCLGLVILTTLLSGLITPSLFHLLAGAQVEFAVWDLVFDLVKIVIIPVIIGLYVQERRFAPVERARPLLQLSVKLYMLLTIAIYAAVMRPHLVQLGWGIGKVIGSMFFQFSISTLLALLFIKWLPIEDIAALAFANAVRNMVGGSIIATAHFPIVVALPLIVSLLLQNPMGSVIYKVFRKSSALLMKEGDDLSTN
ncbi:MAG: bile acid:sodium symporter family protein [Limnochordia bacterium]|jgi:BASS family bile acid:Na+ symporter